MVINFFVSKKCHLLRALKLNLIFNKRFYYHQKRKQGENINGSLQKIYFQIITILQELNSFQFKEVGDLHIAYHNKNSLVLNYTIALFNVGNVINKIKT